MFRLTRMTDYRRYLNVPLNPFVIVEDIILRYNELEERIAEVEGRANLWVVATLND